MKERGEVMTQPEKAVETVWRVCSEWQEMVQSFDFGAIPTKARVAEIIGQLREAIEFEFKRAPEALAAVGSPRQQHCRYFKCLKQVEEFLQKEFKAELLNEWPALPNCLARFILKREAELRKEIATLRATKDQSNFAALKDLQAKLTAANERIGEPLDLVKRAADHCSDNPPDREWFRDLYLITGDHMVLTDEGWEPGNVKDELIKEYGADAILDEVNAK